MYKTPMIKMIRICQNQKELGKIPLKRLNETDYEFIPTLLLRGGIANRYELLSGNWKILGEGTIGRPGSNADIILQIEKLEHGLLHTALAVGDILRGSLQITGKDDGTLCAKDV